MWPNHKHVMQRNFDFFKKTNRMILIITLIEQAINSLEI